ncbi:MAG: hypothetical protein QXH03_02630 [Candidatus Bathyarchaeia archaeon]
MIKLEPKCLTCARLEYNGTHYSCPQNSKFNPKKMPLHFAEKCALYVYGLPKVGTHRVFSSNIFDIEIGENYHTIHLTAKQGYELKIDPESNPQKITIYALKKKGEAK